jgi:hypothetical protein
VTTRSRSVGALALATLCIAVSYAAAFLPGGAPAWAAWLLAFGIATCMVAFMALGASRKGRGVGRLAPVFVVVFVMIAGAFALALGLPPERLGDALWGGLPRRAAILLYGIGLLPLFVLPLAYAFTFEEQTLSEADLERVRAEVRALREREAAASGAGGPPQQHDGVAGADVRHQTIAPAIDASRPSPAAGGAR